MSDFSNAVNKILYPNENEITEHKELYTRINKISPSSISELIGILEEAKRISISSKEEAIKNVVRKFRSYCKDTPTVKEFEKITVEYLVKQKQIEFDKKHPEKSYNDATRMLLHSITRTTTRERFCRISDEEAAEESINHKLEMLKTIYSCLMSYGLKYECIEKRAEEKITYNICITYCEPNKKEKKEVQILLPKKVLIEHYINPYNENRQIMLDGKKINNEWISRFQISTSKFTKDEIAPFLRKKGHIFDEKTQSSKAKYFKECAHVTEDFINTKKTVIRSQGSFVSPERIAELEPISNPNFSLVKLLQLSKELNQAKKEEMVYAQAALLRAICDHIPPIFGKEYTSFEQVASTYRSEKNAKSFKDAMKGLNDFLKPVANSILHSQIRSKESLPSIGQVNFSRELDFLLQEICRLLK